jgi:hypothetical protein
MLYAKELYQQANQLPPLEKLRLAELLLADLDTPDPEIDAIWRDEALNLLPSGSLFKLNHPDCRLSRLKSW